MGWALRRRAKAAVLGAGLCAAAFVLSACGSSGTGAAAASRGSAESSGSNASSGPEHKRFTVGLSVLQLSNPVFQLEYHELRDEGRKLGFDVDVVDANFNPVTQQQQLDTMLNTNAVQALLINPVDPHALVSVLALAAQKGVPVVFGGDLPPGVKHPLTVALSFNWRAYGEQAGGALADCIRTRLGGRAQVALLEGPPLPGNIVTGRIAGERDALRVLPGARIVADVGGTPDQAHAVDAFAAILQAHPGVDAVTGVNDDLMLGVADAYRQAGINPRSVCIQGLDDTPQGQQMVNSGQFWGDVVLPQTTVTSVSSRVLVSLVRDPRSKYRNARPVFIPTRVVETHAK